MDAQLAISTAIKGDWKEAIKINLLLLKQLPKDIDALNRLGRAYTETGQKTKAQETYGKVLKIDKFNTIAKRNLDLLKTLKMNRRDTSPTTTPPPVFLEEPGVTKTISLINLGDPKTITSLRPGAQIAIVCRGHSVSVISSQGSYLGRLPDDLSSRLRIFIQSGNRYSAWIKSLDAKTLKIFIKELSRSTKFKNTPSFPVTEKLSYAAFTPPELIHDEKPLINPSDEDSETPVNEPQEDNRPEEF